MFRLTMTACIEAPPASVWQALARLEDIRLWSRPVVTAVFTPGQERGIGAERVCELVGGIKLTERWLHRRMGRQSLGAFKYLVENGFTQTDLPARLPAPATC